jgi:hypothetical protein
MFCQLSPVTPHLPPSSSHISEHELLHKAKYDKICHDGAEEKHEQDFRNLGRQETIFLFG